MAAGPHADRRARAALAPVVLCLAGLATLGFPGCPEGPTAPGDDTSRALTMSNCWPNEDGRYWNYSIKQWFIVPEEQLILSPPGQQVPEVTTQLAKQLLSKPAEFFREEPYEYHFGMQFRGMRTSAWGIEGQNLVRSLANLGADRPAGATIAPPPGSFRPEGNVYPSPYLIPDRIWVKGPSWIGTYNDADTLLSWKFLDSDLRPGHAFRHLLVQAPTYSIWQLAEVVGKVRAELPDGRIINNAIEVIYVINEEVAEVTDDAGGPLGSYRQFTYGRVTYAPGVGPVAIVERHRGFMGWNIILGDEELRLDLLSTGVNPLPAVAVAEKR